MSAQRLLYAAMSKGRVGGVTPTPPGGPVTAVLTATRISGVAPLAVMFEGWMSMSESPGIVNPFRQLQYSFDFGDPGSGTWSLTGNSKNSYSGGPITAHVFETPGTYTVTLTVYDGVAYATATLTITVEDPDVVFAGAATLVVSPTSNFTGAPPGAATATTVPDNFDNRRILLRRGESHGTINRQKARNCQLGAFGTGDKPRINELQIGTGRPSDNVFPEDVTAMDLKVLTGGIKFGLGRRYLALRCDLNERDVSTINNQFDIGNIYYIYDDPFRIVPLSEFSVNREIFIVDCTALGPYSFNPSGTVYPFWGSGSRIAVMGCDMGHQHMHTMRSVRANRWCIQENWLRGESADDARHALKIHSSGLDEYNDSAIISGKTWCTDMIVVGRNLFGTNASNDAWSVVFAPQNDILVEGLRNIIVENNGFYATTNGFRQDLRAFAANFTYRGNYRAGSGPALVYDMGATSYYTQMEPYPAWNGPYYTS